MRIGELAASTGVAARLLRHYEARGLLPAGRTANAYRDFDDRAVTTVRQIRGVLAAGLSTREIAGLLVEAL